MARYAAVASYAFSLTSHFFRILTQNTVTMMEAVLLYHLLFSLFNIEDQEFMV